MAWVLISAEGLSQASANATEQCLSRMSGVGLWVELHMHMAQHDPCDGPLAPPPPLSPPSQGQDLLRQLAFCLCCLSANALAVTHGHGIRTKAETTTNWSMGKMSRAQLTVCWKEQALQARCLIGRHGEQGQGGGSHSGAQTAGYTQNQPDTTIQQVGHQSSS